MNASPARRLGGVPYLNAAPILYGLDSEPRFALERGTPARVADRLHRGEIDLGLIPSIEYAFGEYCVVPSIAIGSDGPVRSVCLFHRGPLARVQRVAVDASSRTSVALLRLLLREKLGRDPEVVAVSPGLDPMLEKADAALLIGDVALAVAAEGTDRLDLGAAWKALTGLPFVYAFWAGRPDALRDGDRARLQLALERGLSALAAIASTYNSPVLDTESRHAYLRENITYALGEREVEGLKEFYRRCHAAGLIARVPELRFYERA